jgi:hypothetical protein
MRLLKEAPKRATEKAGSVLGEGWLKAVSASLNHSYYYTTVGPTPQLERRTIEERDMFATCRYNGSGAVGRHPYSLERNWPLSDFTD